MEAVCRGLPLYEVRGLDSWDLGGWKAEASLDEGRKL